MHGTGQAGCKAAGCTVPWPFFPQLRSTASPRRVQRRRHNNCASEDNDEVCCFFSGEKPESVLRLQMKKDRRGPVRVALRLAVRLAEQLRAARGGDSRSAQ